jgi:hypothetical protein
MKFDVIKIQALDAPLIHGDFNSKLQKIRLWMMTRMINILFPNNQLS